MKGFYMVVTSGFQGLPEDLIFDIVSKGMAEIEPKEPTFLIFDPEQKKTQHEDGGRTLHIAYPRLDTQKVYVQLDDYGDKETLSENVGRPVHSQYAVTFMLPEER